MLKIEIVKRVRGLRLEKLLSLEDLAARTGLERSFLSRVENEEVIPPWESLERLAAAFGVPLHRLFYDGEQPPSTPFLTPRPTLQELADESRQPPSREEFRSTAKTVE